MLLVERNIRVKLPIHIYSTIDIVLNRTLKSYFLMQEKQMVVFVEASVLEDPALARDPRFQSVHDKLQTFRDGDDLQVRPVKNTPSLRYVSRNFPHHN